MIRDKSRSLNLFNILMFVILLKSSWQKSLKLYPNLYTCLWILTTSQKSLLFVFLIVGPHFPLDNLYKRNCFGNLIFFSYKTYCEPFFDDLIYLLSQRLYLFVFNVDDFCIRIFSMSVNLRDSKVFHTDLILLRNFCLLGSLKLLIFLLCFLFFNLLFAPLWIVHLNIIGEI